MSPAWPMHWAASHRTRTLLRLPALVLLALAAAGCPEQATPAPAADAPCREVGQRCEYAPGKLGSCVVDDDCKGQNCFVCQSQH